MGDKTEWERAGASVLESADRLIRGQRELDYGPPAELFRQWTAMFRDIIGVSVSPKDMVMAMVLLKLLRFKHSEYTHRDSLVDAAGYLGVMERVITGK